MRIYADFNALHGVEDAPALMVERFGTLRELHRLKVKLEEDATYTFWDESDSHEVLEVEGRVVFDHESGQWLATFSWAGLNHTQRPALENKERSFPCFRCREDLSAQIEESGLGRDSLCSSCNLPLNFPIEAPIQ